MGKKHNIFLKRTFFDKMQDRHISFMYQKTEKQNKRKAIKTGDIYDVTLASYVIVINYWIVQNYIFFKILRGLSSPLLKEIIKASTTSASNWLPLFDLISLKAFWGEAPSLYGLKLTIAS